MVCAISLILLMMFSSFLGLTLCGKDSELPRQPCGYMADRIQHFDDFCIRRTLVACSVHVVYLRSGACRFVLLTLPTGGEAGGLTKAGKLFLKKSPATMTAAGVVLIRRGRDIQRRAVPWPSSDGIKMWCA